MWVAVMYRTLFMSKHNSAPISDFFRRSLAFARRSRRKRSKSTRFSQSTAIVPYVGRAINSPCIQLTAFSGPATQCAGGFEHGLLGGHGCILQRRREGNWNMHRAHAFDRNVQIVECARG